MVVSNVNINFSMLKDYMYIEYSSNTDTVK